MFLYGGDAQAGRPASLTYGAVARIAAQELEYEGDAAGGAVDRIFRRCRRTVGSNRCGSTGTRSRSRLVYDSGGRLVARREETHNYDGATVRS